MGYYGIKWGLNQRNDGYFRIDKHGESQQQEVLYAPVGWQTANEAARSLKSSAIWGWFPQRTYHLWLGQMAGAIIFQDMLMA